MRQKRLYLIGAVFSVALMLIFIICFGLFLSETNAFLGIESYIYWMMYQVIIVIISFYQYKVSSYNKKTSIKMSLLYFFPIVIYTLFVLLNLGKINIHPILFFIYFTVFFLTGALYLVIAFIKSDKT